MTIETKPNDKPQTPAAAAPATTAAAPEKKLDGEVALNEKDLDGVVGGRAL